MDSSTEESQNLDDLFEYATNHVKTIVGVLSSEDLLFFYGRYKQSTVGPCNTEKPSFFDFTGKQKWNAWKTLDNMPKVFDTLNTFWHLTDIRNLEPN